MKNTVLMLWATACMLLLSCNEDLVIPTPKFETGIPADTVAKDTADFFALVYIDRPGVDKFFGGDMEAAESQLDLVFRDVTRYWNESNTGAVKFSKYCRFNVAQTVEYDGDSKQCRSEVGRMQWDGEKHNVIVVIDQIIDFPGDSNGSAEGTGDDDRPIVTFYPSSGSTQRDLRETDDYEDAYKVLTHELGHYRGVTDLYQYDIEAANNPVNHESYETLDCIMNNQYRGVWCDYSVYCINANIDQKYRKQPLEFFLGLFPKRLEVNVTVDGTPRRGVTVNLYGSRAGAANRDRDIYPNVAYSLTTDVNGQAAWDNVRSLYSPDKKPINDLPYGRWFGFLVEAVYDTRKAYEWLPEYKVQLPRFEDEEGGDIYTVNLAL